MGGYSPLDPTLDMEKDGKDQLDKAQNNEEVLKEVVKRQDL